jgi:hypothetical protein
MAFEDPIESFTLRDLINFEGVLPTKQSGMTSSATVRRNEDPTRILSGRLQKNGDRLGQDNRMIGRNQKPRGVEIGLFAAFSDLSGDLPETEGDAVSHFGWRAWWREGAPAPSLDLAPKFVVLWMEDNDPLCETRLTQGGQNAGDDGFSSQVQQKLRHPHATASSGRRHQSEEKYFGLVIGHANRSFY